MKWFAILLVLLPLALCRPSAPKPKSNWKALLGNITALNTVLESQIVLKLTSCTLDQMKLVEPLIDNCTDFIAHFKHASDVIDGIKQICKMDNFINAHNSNSSNTFEVGHNCFSLLTPEHVSKRKGHVQPTNAKRGLVNGPYVDNYQYNFKYYQKSGMQLPSSFSWVTGNGKYSFNTPIQNQGQCGCCWAFSSAAALQFQVYKKTGINQPISVQQYIDCTDGQGAYGCNGGSAMAAYGYNMHVAGQVFASAYPFVLSDGQQESDACSVPSGAQSFKASSYFQVSPGDDQGLMEVLYTYGPVSIAIDASQPGFQTYTSGVFNQCGQNVDHAILLVGWGVDPKQGKYWIVKNQWDVTWGNKGYMWMDRNGSNSCGISSSAMMPQL